LGYICTIRQSLFLIEEALGMTNSNGSSDRLDRIEALMEQQAEESIRQAARWAETRQIVESNARAIAANSDAMARQREELRANVTDLVSMITASAEQAEIDRAEFRATVRQLLETLNQRFTSNGH
jgi:hypothetical protein